MNCRRRRVLLLITFLAFLLMAKHYFRSPSSGEEELQLSEWFRPRGRPDVITITDWLAPVVWEGTFSRQALEKYYRKRNITVGLAILALEGFEDEYLEQFLLSANRFFMPGHRVVFYILTDDYIQLPDVVDNPLQTFQMLLLDEERMWSDLDLMRMKALGQHIVEHIKDEVDFLFSMTTDQVFQNEFGVETLGTSVAQLHAWWYFRKTKDFPYERQLRSAAYIPFGQGDFFYGGSLVGGTPRQVLDLIEQYLKGAIQDIENRLNSTYEKYLNKYFFLNKPTKLLSPEYSWDPTFRIPPQVRFVKVAQHPSDRF